MPKPKRKTRRTAKQATPKASESLLFSAPAPLVLELPPFDLVHITLVGCGGTGSHLATGLAALALELKGRDIQCVIDFVDFDLVEPKNVGRQLFAVHEVGAFKSEVLAQRLMRAYPVPLGYFKSGVENYDLTPQGNALNIVIGAVDNPAARAVIASAVDEAAGSLWWLNCGNENASGQVAIGNVGTAKAMRGAVELGMINRLPAPHVLYPDCIATPKLSKTKRAASCAELTASGEQGLMVNRMVAAWALELMQRMLIQRHLNWFAVAFDLVWGNAKAFTLDAVTLAEATGLTVKELGA